MDQRKKTWDSDSELVEQILAGSHEHFELLYEAYFPRVYRFALKKLRDPGEAEDVTQEVFMTLLSARASISAAVLAILLLVAGCAGVPAANAQEDTEWRGSRGGKVAFSVVVARTASVWWDLWDGIGRPPPQELDANREIAVAIFLGQRRTGGFGVTIESVELRDGFMVVRFQETRPGADSMVSQALTSPYLVRLIPKTDFPVAFESADALGQLLFDPESEAQLLEYSDPALHAYNLKALFKEVDELLKRLGDG